MTKAYKGVHCVTVKGLSFFDKNRGKGSPRRSDHARPSNVPDSWKCCHANWGYTGIMENNMETTIGFRVWGLGLKEMKIPLE